MFAALIFVISVAALAQFGLFTWRAGLLSLADHPLSEQICNAAGISANSISPEDFETLSSLHKVCPELKQASRELWPVRVYYNMVRALGWLGGNKLPWASSEMALCTRYVAVVIDQRLQRNQACLAQLSSY
jgi:hypothetical protein